MSYISCGENLDLLSVRLCPWSCSGLHSISPVRQSPDTMVTRAKQTVADFLFHRTPVHTTLRRTERIALILLTYAMNLANLSRSCICDAQPEFADPLRQVPLTSQPPCLPLSSAPRCCLKSWRCSMDFKAFIATIAADRRAIPDTLPFSSLFLLH